MKDTSDLRVQFNLSLARVYKPASQQRGVTECHKSIKDNCDDRQSLRVFISALCDKSLLVGKP